MNKIMSNANNPKWILITLILLSACQNKETVTILSGQLTDYKNETLTLIPVAAYFPGLEPANKELLTTQTDSLGNFIFRSDKIEPGFYQVIQRNFHRLNYDIYLEKGDSIYIDQAWEAQTFNISGKGAEKLQHLVHDNKYFHKDSKYYDTIRSKGFKTELLFKAFIDTLFNKRITEINANKDVSAQLKVHFINGVYADKASTLLQHLESRNYTMNEEFSFYYPDTTYYSFLKDIAFDDAFCQNSESKSLAQHFLANKARYAFKNSGDEKWWRENFSWRLNYVSNQPQSTWNDLLTMSLIGQYSFGMSNDDFFQNISAFDEKTKTIFKHESDQQLFQHNSVAFLNLAPGKPAPDFALPDSGGNIMKLSDYKGKIVYVDIWGTWCGPCIQEIPGALKLQDEYKNKPVVFLYVALEYDKNDIAGWRNFIAGKNKRFLDEPFTGIHVVAEKQFGNEEIAPYKINYAPTHILIDHKGNIVQARAGGVDKISKEIDRLLEIMDN
jgi:thiol-disulfide isomerase/thioredoxin